MLKRMVFPVTGTKGWKEAQVTSGGVSLDEVDSATMESKLVRGLFFAGEVLDYDGACGGFNLNWAFNTGMKAGRAAAKAADA
jgi:predicted flavoprotein YhiN